MLSMAMVALLCGCESISNRCAIMGDYESSYEESFHDGIECKVRWDFVEEFNLFTVDGKAKMYMTFMFDEQFEFKNLTLEYDVMLSGKWSYDGDRLEVLADTTTFKYEYVKSDATRYTEEAMARYLRKHVKDDFIPSMRKKFIALSDRSIKVKAVTDSCVVAVDPRDESEVKMFKKTK
jgi:hypothetical protein